MRPLSLFTSPFLVVPEFDFPPVCTWIETCDRRELARVLPRGGSPVMLSCPAWQLSAPEARALIVPGDARMPWQLSAQGFDEALRVQRAAIASGGKLMPLRTRREEVEREARSICFSRRAVLSLLRRCGAEVSGVAPSGQRAVLDALLLPSLVLTLDKDTGMTPDGSLYWRALAAAWPAEAVTTPTPRPPPRPSPRQARRTVQGELAVWYRRTYPAGHPVGKKLDVLAFEASETIGRAVSARTVRRALVELREKGTSAAS